MKEPASATRTSEKPEQKGLAMTVGVVEFAADTGLALTKQLGRNEQKQLGQFLTPPGIARFMAQRAIAGVFGETIRVLEPAAGAGILAAAAVEAILSRENRPRCITVTLFEIDTRLLPALRKLAYRMRQVSRDAGVMLRMSIRCEDFLLAHEAIRQRHMADIVIANPPYFKVGSDDARSLAHAYAVHGQPNIYGLFMAASAALVAPGGRWCFITPRSWTNGAYFSAVRRQILRNLTIDAMHVFESRKDHFTDDEVLQEAMITWATAQGPGNNRVVVSYSRGLMDLPDAALRALPTNEIIGGDDDRLIALRTEEDHLAGLTATLETHGLKVSTGPVVAFRAKECLRQHIGANTVPLLWMQHVGHMKVQWPIQKKREHIVANAKCAWMLVANTPMVILRRFSPKEDPRRITAAVYTGELPGTVLGLENHLNYIYRPGGVMTPQEVLGLAAYLNSRLVDGHLRAVAGSTQVNASELRKLPLPSIDQLIAIGGICRPGMSLAEVDRVVETILGLDMACAVG
ncbi:conserved hypothetical protein [Acidithiobacillus caldus SM-1]|uniref:site-specific DNA-methyltransferase (adenine-specific) n=2 Tax=Acidithiobacillus caldus TaxID=33059 RepID=F9ZR33_ACICS|nr:Eco57I restriction-modification methylase domain-containing protein [Acidithiobacillus caldus]AEK58728.1 conserved hypothetical protein [Acidithiobacillus caldus SM-1]OFC60834.1 hypothetical protein BAE30_07010 [Acidithiobacillus caldus]